MPVNLDTRSIESSTATEIYISATPTENVPPQEQAKEIFSRIRDILRSKKARILHERVFLTQNVMEIVASVRSKEYGDIDDGVAPGFLVGSEGMFGPIAGVQVHTVSSDSSPEVINLEGTACGRILRVPGRTYLTLSQLSAAHLAQPTEQAQAMLEKAESAL